MNGKKKNDRKKQHTNTHSSQHGEQSIDNKRNENETKQQ